MRARSGIKAFRTAACVLCFWRSSDGTVTKAANARVCVSSLTVGLSEQIELW